MRSRGTKKSPKHLFQWLQTTAGEVVMQLPPGVALILLFWGAKNLLLRYAYLPEQAYEGQFLLLAFVREVPLLLWGIALVLTIITVLLAGKKHLWSDWDSVDPSGFIKWTISLLIVLVTWIFATYSFNAYYGQWHLADRLLLIALAILSLRKPAFVMPFLVVLFVIIGQFNHPLGISYARPIINFLCGGLILFAVYFLASGLHSKWRPGHFTFVFFCLLATQYWVSGWGKIGLEWWNNDHMMYIFPAAYTHGWASFLSPETVSGITGYLAPFNSILVALVLIIECGSLLFFGNRKFAAFLLSSWILFHIGVFLMTGFCFWPWIVLELLLLFFFWQQRFQDQFALWGPAHGVLAIVIIGLGQWWAAPAKLAWLDTSLSYSFRLEVSRVYGGPVALPPSFFGAYSDIFTFSQFNDLCAKPQLVGPYGVTGSQNIAKRLCQTTVTDSVLAWESRTAPHEVDTYARSCFFTFVQSCLANKAKTDEPVWLNWIQPPPLFWSFSRYPVYNGRSPLNGVSLFRVTGFYDGKAYREIENTRIQSLDF